MTSTVSNIEGRIRTETVVPANPVAGDMYYDTTNERLMRFNGTYWSGVLFTISTSTSTTISTSTTLTTSTSVTTTSSSTTRSTSTSISTSTTTTL